MSAYDLDDERAIRTGRLVEDWTKSGLLNQEQRDILIPQMAVDLRRTNKFLRITLFVFGGIILQSALGLFAVALFDVSNAAGAGVLCLVVGAGCFWLASHLVSRYHLYRFGVEEAAALSAAGLVAAGAALLITDVGVGDWPLVIGLATAAAMLFVLFRHFGYVYAAVFALVAAAALPFQLGSSEPIERLLAVVILAAAAAAARAARAEHGDEYPGDGLMVIEAAAWLGIYVLVNLVLSSGVSRVDRGSVVHWITYAAIWVLPAIVLWLAIRGRERPLLWSGVAMALGTLLSNKEYLGSRRHEWDPMVFGLLLMAIAVGVRRWLAAGEDGRRRGYTASRLVASDRDLTGHLALVSAAQVEVPVTASTPTPDPSIGGGGRSGGAGAGGTF
ncbi:MAG: hypothetical protein Q8T13_04200 [Acidobacteriota bacterium]|nr:hypothetical protein [Acidobacteriota bacterium]